MYADKQINCISPADKNLLSMYLTISSAFFFFSLFNPHKSSKVLDLFQTY